jgi:hypothetical protein
MALDIDMLLVSGSANLGGVTGAAVSTAALDMGADIADKTYVMNIPVAPADTTLTAAIQSSDTTTDGDFKTFVQMVSDAGSPGNYYVSGQTPKRYRRVRHTVTGANANDGTGFGKVVIGIQGAGRNKKY